MKKGIGPKALGSPIKQKVEVKRKPLTEIKTDSPRRTSIYQVGDPMKGAELPDPSLSDADKLHRAKKDLRSARHGFGGPGYEHIDPLKSHPLDDITKEDIKSGNFPASGSLNPGGFDRSPSVKPRKKDVRQAKTSSFFGKFKRKK